MRRNLLKNAMPFILTCLGAGGMVATVVTAIKATPKAVELIKADSRQAHDGDPYGYTKVEAVKSAWKEYIPTAILGVSSLVCIFSAHILSKRSQAALVGGYELLRQSYSKYRKAAKEVYGEDADEKITEQVVKDAYVSADGCSLYSPDEDNHSDKVLFCDWFSNRYFRATMSTVINAEYHINRNLVLRGDVSVNEFYEFLGLDGIENGDVTGWSINEFVDEGLESWIDFDNRPTMLHDGTECYVISPLYDPIHPIE